ncbi:YgdI/YgdR family lipoprotein [Stutzerimonas stutzeri]|uniref:YgdI/YgdR family lipoprotein n=1 Tax=Stutzerimonas stutzeri TaxID=316 RepID=UPI00210B20B7|nr:YgdI/YgdR family lipoprotein [Stutzerimonas stutzeri]MCQ4320267.1 YgdI/YgdR family lipoprotein [Stutzerimonas stutzeri]
MRTITGPALAALVGMTLLTGCSNPSVITLNDGREIQTLDQPEYDDEAGFYEFEGIDGKPGRVNKDQVRTVEEL